MKTLMCVILVVVLLDLVTGFGTNFWKLRNMVEKHRRQRVEESLKKQKSHNFLIKPGTWSSPPKFPDMYLRQPLDHFDPLVKDTYKQRYWVNPDFWQKPDGPVFLYIGGEGGLYEGVVTGGEYVHFAKNYSALIVAVEHRYYGASINNDGLMLENIRYLSSQQALADLAAFHAFLSEKYALTERNTWVCFGGSYPGALSAWYRLKYPHLVYGAIASSAPVRATVNFEGYNEVVAASMADPVVNGSEKCAAYLSEAFKTVDQMLDNGQMEDLAMDFKSCQSLEDHHDIYQFVSGLADIFMGTVQYNGEAPGMNISILCQNITKTPNPYNNLRMLMLEFLKLSHQKCNDNSWSKSLKELMNTTVEKPPGGVGMRQWIYQTCTQFGYYQSCDVNTTCPFSKYMKLDYSLEICNEVFGIAREDVYRQVDFSNAYYGSNHPKGTRIVFVNGSIDPWHALSVLENLSDTETAIFINGTAHCANMEENRPGDLPALRKAREEIGQQIGKWLDEARREHGKADTKLYFRQV